MLLDDFTVGGSGEKGSTKLQCSMAEKDAEYLKKLQERIVNM